MNNSFFVGLIYNASLLLVMISVFHLVVSRTKKIHPHLWQVWVGILLSVIGLAIIESNWEILPGVIFDTRTVLLSSAGLFFGFIPTLITMLVTSVYRIIIGGDGMIAGVAEIVIAGTIGLIWRHFRIKKLFELSWVEIYLFGLLIHAIDLALIILLPLEIRQEIFSKIWFPIMVIDPLATMILGLLLSARLKAALTSKELFEREQKARALFDLSFEFIGLLTPDGTLLDVNRTALDFVGAKFSEVVGKPFWKTPWWNYAPDIQAQIKKAIHVAATGKLVREETTHRAKDGTIHVIDFTVKPVFDESKRVIYLIPEGRDVTEQKQSEELLEKSEERYRILFENVPSINFILDTSGKILSCNHYVSEKLGYLPDELIGKSVIDIIFDEDKGQVEKQRKEILGNPNNVYEWEIRKVHKDGQIIWVKEVARAIKDQSGRVVILITCQDISENKRSEKALRESEFFFKESQRAANIGSYKTNFLTGMWESSEVLDQIFGIDNNYHRSVEGWLDLIHPEDKEMMSRHLQEEVLAKRLPFNKEYRIIRPSDSETRWVYGLGQVGLGQEENVISLIGTIQDITNRKKTEDALRESEIKLRATLESTADGILAVDNGGKIIFVNRRFSDMWQIPQSLTESGDDRLLLNFVKEKLIDPDQFIQIVKALYASDVVEMDTLLFKDGRIYERYSFPMATNGVRIGRVWSFRDVTKERELDKMKTDFVSLASHQLRSPLTGIKWFVELLSSDTTKIPPEKIQEYLGNIGKSNERMIALVSDLLITAKIESGKVKKEPTECSLRHLLEDVLDDQKIILQDKKITVLGLEKISPDWKIEVDLVQLTQVFGNLINNAASYSPVGSQIEIGAKILDGRIKIYVRDQGFGIPVSQQSKIFNKFFRGDNVAKTIAGSGLGLYVAKGMVENHHGKIWFESEEGKGTTFFVELPLKQNNNTSNL